MRTRAAAAGIAVLGLATPPASAASTYGSLPSPNQPLRTAPPLRAPQASFSEQRVPGRLRARERVHVAVDRSGRPVHIVVDQTLTVLGKGDYSFVVSGPVEDVRPLGASQSPPGLRTGGVVWQGFSPGTRTLAAAITVRREAAVSGLPLRIDIAGDRLRLANATAATTTGLASPAPVRALAAALETARAAISRGHAIGAQLVRLSGAAREERVRVVLPLHVRGVAQFSGGSRQVNIDLASEPVSIHGEGRLRKLVLRVDVPFPRALLAPAGARSWREAAARARLGNGAAATRATVRRLLSAALAAQFQAFLANPVVGGTAETGYDYRLAAGSSAAAARGSDGSATWWLPVVLAVVGIVAVAAGVVAWAHS
jgi:hypothetical protein